MSYFLPYFFQKRILRYALSRLELLDTDALDLDRLDVEWGKKSTIELREVGIHTKKLAALLKLPSGLKIISAQIFLLRLTVPADLYQSGIRVEVHGVGVQISAEFNNGKPGFEEAAKGVKGDRPRSNQSQVHDPGGCNNRGVEAEDNDDLMGRLPDTVDLAESFLHTELKDERAELQASVGNSQYLDQSRTATDGAGAGIGNPVSLPTFLADFLKGVVNRVELSLQKIELDISLKICRRSESCVGNDATEKGDHVTFRLTTESVHVDGITTHKQKIKSAAEAHSLVLQERRRITLSNVKILVISEASLFADLARSMPTSPSETQDQSSAARSSYPASSVHPTANPDPFDDPSNADLLLGSSMGLGFINTGRDSKEAVAKVVNKEENGQTSSRSSSISSISESDDYLVAGSTKTIEDTNQDEKVGPLRSSPILHSQSGSPVPSTNQTNLTPLISLSRRTELSRTRDTPASQVAQASGAHSTKKSWRPKTPAKFPSETYQSSSDTEDLTESRIFTHKEASVYMSAISHGPLEGNAMDVATPDVCDSAESKQAKCYASRDSIEAPSKREQDEDGRLHHYTVARSQPAASTCSEDLAKRSFQISQASNTGEASGHTSIAQGKFETWVTTTKDDSSSSQDSGNSANMKSSLTIAKQIISIDSICAIIPMHSGRQQVYAEAQIQNPRSANQVMPGDFGSVSGAFVIDSVGEAPNPAPLHGDRDQIATEQVSIEVGEMNIVGDMGLTRMMVLISQRLNAIRRHHLPEGNTDQPKLVKSQKDGLRLTVKRIGWSFLDAVRGEPLPKSDQELSATDSKPFHRDSEILLKASIDKFLTTYKVLDVSSITQVSIGKFNFGYRSGDILSFDPDLKMRDSTRDIKGPVDNDIMLTINQNPTMLTMDLTTLPIHVTLDLRRLDETFSWFGGFSSIIGLGNSMMSTMTVIEVKPKAAQASKSTRGVHFESPGKAEPLRRGPTPPQNKVTARIGSLALDLQGSQSSVCLETTALKIVSRTEGLGLQVDRLRFKGPYLKEDMFEPSILMQLTNLRVEYLAVPKEVDLARLLALLSPSKVKGAHDDDILLDTLLRQRQQGAVVRATVENLDCDIKELHDLRFVPLLAEDLKKLSTVAKYLPEDDRPGLLNLGLIKNIQLSIRVNDTFGLATLEAKNLEWAYVTFPILLALGISTLRLHRNLTEELLGPALPTELTTNHGLPSIMARYIGNEMEPIAKIMFHDLRLEYHVSTVLAIMGLTEASDTEALTEMINSVITITTHHAVATPLPESKNQDSPSSSISAFSLKSPKLDITIRDSILGLNPGNSSSKGLLVLTDTHLQVSGAKREETQITLEVRKASIMAIDNIENFVNGRNISSKRKGGHGHPSQLEGLSDMGYVSIGLVSALKATTTSSITQPRNESAINVEITDGLLVLESCADSTQTLSCILGGLKPPVPRSTERKYMTEVVPIEDMLASLSGDAFATTKSTTKNDDLPLGLDEGDMVDDEVPQNLEFLSSFYNPEPNAAYDEIADSALDEDLESLASPSLMREIGSKNLLESFQDQAQVAPGNSLLDFREDHFGASSSALDIPKAWVTKQRNGGPSASYDSNVSALKLRVRGLHVIWNLFDGYDWQHTRDTISQAIETVQNQATERLARKEKRKSSELDEEEESVIGDFLFNSIYIGIPANRDPKELTHQVNRNLDDFASESESYATSASSDSPSRQGRAPYAKGKKLRLKRSGYHKMTFELKGVSIDAIVTPSGPEGVQSSADVRIKDLEIFDHVPTSTWKKFATYMHDVGERQSGTSMIHLQITNVKPVPHLAASEIMLKATVLPLRLHVDQDALDFLTRFFEFKDSATSIEKDDSDPPFFQRVEINAVQVKLDFKPKRVDYGGIRSGHTTEFMNFFVLDRADMVLRHVIIYGVLGLDKLGKTLNDIWMPDVKRNQLPGILAGLAPVRSLVNVGGGVRDLVVVPIREYQKDGRIVRSFQKGALAFAKTTTTELVRLGAKLAIGTQTVLQGAEDLLSPLSSDRPDVSSEWEDPKMDEEEKEQISKYANQPVGVVQGLRGAYASLECDLLMAKDAVIAMPGEALESRTAGGAAKAVMRGAPTVILRPAMGVSKAVGQTLLGATNSLDPANKRRIEDKYKRH